MLPEPQRYSSKEFSKWNAIVKNAPQTPSLSLYLISMYEHDTSSSELDSKSAFGHYGLSLMFDSL
jgi:hypothetical protein